MMMQTITTAKAKAMYHMARLYQRLNLPTPASFPYQRDATGDPLFYISLPSEC